MLFMHNKCIVGPRLCTMLQFFGPPLRISTKQASKQCLCEIYTNDQCSLQCQQWNNRRTIWYKNKRQQSSTAGQRASGRYM